MRIVLIGDKHIIKYNLPKNVIENYWIIDRTQQPERRIISITANKEKYEILSSNYSEIINPKYFEKYFNDLQTANIFANTVKSVILEEYSIYSIIMNDTKEIYTIYCLPDYEDNFIHLDMTETHQITIGSSENNTIVYKRPFISDVHAKIVKFNGKWILENCNSQYGSFVNDFPVYDSIKNIFNGDVIFIMGLEIIIIKDSIYINNPQNSVTFNKRYFTPSKIKTPPINIKTIQKEQEQKLKEPNAIDFYFRSPRMLPPIKKEQVKIDEPPELVEQPQRPAILIFGSSIAMGVMMLASMTSTIQGIANGTASFIEILIGFATTIAMLIAMLIIPILDAKWDKKSNKKYEQKRQKRYKEYLNKKNEQINEIKKKQKQLLYNNYLSADECIKIISSNNHRLWERKITDEDFLDIRIGIGEVPLKVDIAYPQEKFAMVDDNLIELFNDIVKNSTTVKNAPVIVPLRNNRITSIIARDEEVRNKYLKNIILQLITFHSYEDLKLVFLLNENTSKEWQYVKMLPHVWDDSKQIRFFADNYTDRSEISKYLLEILTNRIEGRDEGEDNIYYTSFTPHYLIITDDYKQIENLNIIGELAKVKENKGFSLLCVTDDLYSLPSGCETFIELTDKTKGTLFERSKDSSNQTEITTDQSTIIFFEKITQKLANILIKTKKELTALPSSYSFLEMYNVGNIEQLEIEKRWKKNDSSLSLKAPIGIDYNGMIIYLDAHEKFHGPHGLIAGSTGSGKSEFIITYILSLAINYHPDDVTFLLIDYKGGGLAGAFQKNNIKLPHLVGTITNIDKNGLKRSLISIQSELRRRQVIFNQARDETNEGTIDIYKYQTLYHNGIVKEPISHLFIICDEFAELKQQQPEFMDELVSVSRIGRSLGVHLILATQKPSGIVDDQIRGNSKFAICLKVQDPLDSQDVIDRSDAAYLGNPGQFYLKVGQNEYFVLGQSGWAGAPYIASNEPIKKIDNSVEFVSNIGLPIKKINETKQQNYNSQGEQLTNLLKYIYNLANEENIKKKNLWLEDIPTDIYVKDIRNKYNVKETKNIIKVIIGEYDNPANQQQGPVEFDLTKKENMIIYGNAESGKETLLSTMIYDLMTTYKTRSSTNVYIRLWNRSIKNIQK